MIELLFSAAVLSGLLYINRNINIYNQGVRKDRSIAQNIWDDKSFDPININKLFQSSRTPYSAPPDHIYQSGYEVVKHGLKDVQKLADIGMVAKDMNTMGKMHYWDSINLPPNSDTKVTYTPAGDLVLPRVVRNVVTRYSVFPSTMSNFASDL